MLFTLSREVLFCGVKRRVTSVRTTRWSEYRCYQFDGFHHAMCSLCVRIRKVPCDRCPTSLSEMINDP